mmetsp:Transcript_12191/g.14002  ORF Transcript_12191/g.14002 Transcript_12191/m.14002 type:complete len:100 (-) Transcript_12191:394-693(-)
MSHIILLEQPAGKDTRTYRDYENMKQCSEYLVKLFERTLKQLNPGVKNISYSVSDVVNFLDTYTDLCVLSFQNQTDTYAPRQRQWVKKQVSNYMKQREP